MVSAFDFTYQRVFRKFLLEAGYKNIKIFGVQRFSIANHLQWAVNRIPGGHRGELAYLEESELVKSYQNALIE